MASKKKTVKAKEVADATNAVETGTSKGCEKCSNTGLEPGVSRDTAQVCPVCKGIPFEPREEVK